MAVTIQGIRIKSISVQQQAEGSDKISSDYELISSVGKVLAKQSLSSVQGYGETLFVPSATTQKMFAEAVASYQRDAEQHLGLI